MDSIIEILKVLKKFRDEREWGQFHNSKDLEIWNYARNCNFTIISFDSDFYDFSLLYGHPPKIIWLRTFNQSTNNIEVLLTKFIEQIKEFLDDNDDNSCLEILDKL